MTRWGFDSYASLPDPAHAYQQGWRVSARYISGIVNKDTTAAEQQADHAAGLDTLINWELNINDALQGVPAGQSVGQRASSMAHNLGAPTHNPDGTRVAIYYSCDTAASADQVRGYYQGIRSVTDYAVGAYGGTEMAQLLHEGVIDYWWQAAPGSWNGHPTSDFATDPAACVRQYANVPAAAPANPGIPIDVNEFTAADCGLWLAKGGPEVLDQNDPFIQAQKVVNADLQARVAEIQNSFDGQDPDPLDPTGQRKIGLRFLLFEVAKEVGQIKSELEAMKSATTTTGPAGTFTMSDADMDRLVTKVLDGQRAHPSAPIA